MEFLKSSKRRTLVSELVYIILNIGLAAAVLVSILVTQSPLLAIAIVLLSKWRVFAVRPRFWVANVKANLVDVIVGVSLAVLIGVSMSTLMVQLLLTAAYIGWLLFVKPRSSRAYVAAQAATAVFLGITALMTVSYGWASSVVVLGMWVIGYASSRHVFTSYEEAHSSFYSFVWGLIMAELGWLAYHWTFAYALGSTTLKLPQVALIGLGVSFLAERVYNSYRTHGSVRSQDVMLPALLSVSVIIVLITVFNRLSTGSL
jgi:hypothetical protein